MAGEEELLPPTIDWSNFTDGEIPLTPPNEKCMLLAMDTEYQTNHTANTNLGLTYQYSLYDLLTGKYKCGIFYMNVSKNERLTFSEFIHRVLKESQIEISSLEGFKIVLIAHYFTAEWAMFKDRNKLYKKFEYIRKTLVTLNRSLKTTIKDEEGKTINLWVDVKDTMLLLPEKFKSLEKASSFIKGYEKINLPEEIKRNMYQFLKDNPEDFEKYAIRDAEVTLKLFIKLQYLLNMINGTKDTLYTTLASATTNDFKNFSKHKFQEIEIIDLESKKKESLGKSIHKMQFDRLHSLYKKYESLANRSYMGGLNSSYYMGYCKGYTFLDIDFKNAYPTAMNLIKIGNFGDKLKKIKKLKMKLSLGDLL
ncbi:hypothetical protein L5F50_01270 [Aliarcobacter butzleri]|nr:hypothetical protein [Aliarcobacter butzleri]